MTISSEGPLTGLRVVEFAGIGPAPFACMLMADMGADIIRIDRANAPCDPLDLTLRSRRHVELDLKRQDDREKALLLVEKADILVEGFRPGVMERLGIGPGAVFERNKRAIYGRITGWGQNGPLTNSAGHDINYIAISGALDAIGPAEAPVPPLNLVGDYAGGALYLVVGILAALFEVQRSGQGQVVDAAMSDGAASLMTLFHSLAAKGQWAPERMVNFLDGAAPYYRTYRCSDGGHVAVGALEPQFYRQLCSLIGRHQDDVVTRLDRKNWPALTQEFETIFAARSSKEWTALLEGTDACVAPVIQFHDAPTHPHNVARETFVTVDGIVQPSPAPRFSRTPSRISSPPPHEADPFDEVLRRWA